MYDEKWALEHAVEIAKKSKCQSQRGVVIWHRTLDRIKSIENSEYKLIFKWGY